jgi:hypothetical protein
LAVVAEVVTAAETVVMQPTLEAMEEIQHLVDMLLTVAAVAEAHIMTVIQLLVAEVAEAE